MTPVNFPPWAIKLASIFAILAVAFGAGCRVQKKMDLAKIQRIKANYDRCVGIVDQFQENYDVLEKGLEDQNKAIEDLGRESEKRIARLTEAHKEAVKQLQRDYSRTIEEKSKEAAKLRKKLAGLSVAEACIEAWREVAQ